MKSGPLKEIKVRRRQKKRFVIPLLSPDEFLEAALQHRHIGEKMTSADSGPHSVGHGEHELQHDSLLPTNGNTDTFAAFLDEFTEGASPQPYTREMESVSSEDYSCHKTYADILDTAAAVSTSVATADESLYKARGDGCNNPRVSPSGSTATCVDSSPVIDQDGRVILHSSVRKLTNSTYLRRMHLSKKDALGLFPEVNCSLEFIFRTNVTRRESSTPMKKGLLVYIHDIKGRRWPVVVECLRTAGQRHVRFNKGWAEVCSANRISVGMCVRLARWKEESSSSCDITDAHVVTLSRV